MFTGGVTECDAALEFLIVETSVEMKQILTGLQQTITWRVRAGGAFLYLHPGIYGDASCNQVWRLEKVAAALGVSVDAVRRWFSLQIQIKPQSHWSRNGCQLCKR